MPDPAPLVSIPEAPAPDGRAEWFEGARGAKLRAGLFPAPNPRGSVVLSTGRTEPIEKYYEVIRELTAAASPCWPTTGAARARPIALLLSAAGHAEESRTS